ncbi:LysR family transcriptional regulator [Lentibacter algarum]|uniref:LysR family transcriptional regulator n=1 Tax=Lentibacter algarum TaxID=576131 RepID=UPI001C07416C|nr:LysR family transcriptional regulator [Lentibacter algarum]MBU2981295.1 LysR family transcriptional regulator [Lentibacter algarum]
MPYVESIKVFVRVVELGSITSGGRDLRLTPAVASNRIKELEKRLGLRLFDRTTRKLRTTEAGELFYDHACKVIAALDDAEAVLAGFSGQPRGVLRVSAPLGLGQRMIAPLVPAFSDEHPEVQVQLRLTDRRIDMLDDRLDAAFVLGELPDSNFKQRKIADCPRMLAAAPGYLAKHGTPKTPEDLSKHNCLLLRFPRSPEYFWTLQTDSGPKKLNLRGRFDADTGDVLTAWALAEQGIINKPRIELEAHLQSGALVEVLPDTPPMPTPFVCLYPHRKLQDPKISLFIDHMLDALKPQLK